MKIREIAKMVNIADQCVFNILHESLGMKKAIDKMGARYTHSGSKDELDKKTVARIPRDVLVCRFKFSIRGCNTGYGF